MRTKEFE